MSTRYKTRLAAGIEEEERRAKQDESLREKFEKKEETVVFVESFPEKLFRMTLLVISSALAIVGIVALLLPETRLLLFEVFVKFIEEATGMIGISP